MQLPVLQIPRAFAAHGGILQILGATADEFGYDERCAIYYHYLMNMPTCAIANAVELSEGHVASAISLFATRLDAKLDFFKTVQPHDQDDCIPVRDILLTWDEK